MWSRTRKRRRKRKRKRQEVKEEAVFLSENFQGGKTRLISGPSRGGGIFQWGTNALPCSFKRNPEDEEKEEVGKEDKKEVKEKRGRRGGGKEKGEGEG